MATQGLSVSRTFNYIVPLPLDFSPKEETIPDFIEACYLSSPEHISE